MKKRSKDGREPLLQELWSGNITPSFENCLYPENTSRFLSTLRRGNSKTHQSLAMLDLCLRKITSRRHGLVWTVDLIVEMTLRFQNLFRPH